MPPNAHFPKFCPFCDLVCESLLQKLRLLANMRSTLDNGVSEQRTAVRRTDTLIRIMDRGCPVAAAYGWTIEAAYG